MRISYETYKKREQSARDSYLAKNSNEVLVADDYFSQLLHEILERGFLNKGIKKDTYRNKSLKKYPVDWLQINRLPIHPSMDESYDLLSKWQSTLSMAHMLNHRIVFLLQRHKGKTSIYLGANNKGTGTNEMAVEQLAHSSKIHMPGISVSKVVNSESVENKIDTMSCAGIVTGIPSLRSNDKKNLIQTLDKLAGGIENRNYNLIVIADPVPDEEISSLMSTLLNLQSELHDSVLTTSSEGFNQTEGKNSGSSASISIGKIVGGLCVAGLCVATGFGAVALPVALSAVEGKDTMGELLGLGVTHYSGKSRSYSTSNSVSRQYLNSVAKYCEDLIQKHVHRLEKGRNLGFWNTGVYVLGDSNDTVDYVLGSLRSIYAGDESYTEPIRVFNCGNHPDIVTCISNFDLVSLPVSDELKKAAMNAIDRNDSWHILGPLYENYTTALNTEELSITTSLPRRDVPGLKFVRNTVKFAANPPGILSDHSVINLGKIVDSGILTSSDYLISVNEFNRHALLCGMTGSGKSVTTKRILMEMNDKDIPFLVIEPAKTDYVQWAMEYNRSLDTRGLDQQTKNKLKINIYMPGATDFQGYKVQQLQLNPFQPGATAEGSLHLMEHLDALISILSASMPMGDVLPLILEETVYELAIGIWGQEALTNEIKLSSIKEYPRLSQMKKVSELIISNRGYAPEVSSNLTAAMKTRIAGLLRGWKSKVFDAAFSTPAEQLFQNRVIINLDRISVNSDKALLMSLILLYLREYRKSIYLTDSSYFASLKQTDCLKHFTVIEEAHRILTRPEMCMEHSNAQRIATDLFCDMIAEIRSLGEGIMIVDQSPSKLVPEVIKNTNIKIIHRVSSRDDREVVSNCMGLRKDQEDMIASLEKGNVILCSEQDDAALWVKINK
jgi:hypothetical protein